MQFADAADRWLQHIAHTRTAPEVARVLRLRLLPHLGSKPIADIRKRDLIALIDDVALRSPSNGHHLLSYSRRLFNWACARDLIDTNPAAHLSPRLLIGPQPIRQRVLDDRELARIWYAAGELGQFGSLVQMLMLTGQRRGEVVGLRWSEVSDLNGPEPLWTIPASRHKSGTAHRVPLAGATARLLQGLAREGELAFPSAVSLERPMSGFGRCKARLDRESGISGWVLHDLRRSMRTGMARLGVRDEIGELALGHAKQGLARIYNLHRYEAELRQAFEGWAQHLGSVTACARGAGTPVPG